jgi:hypothetical protein
MGESSEHEDLMSAQAELRRIDRTATIWFAAAVIAVALPVGALLLGGWRPADLPAPAAFVWWVGAVLIGLGLGGIGYAGCPVYWGNVPTAHLQKSIAIRGGCACFIIGSFVALVAVLVS